MNHTSVESGHMCLFVEGDQHHNLNPRQFRSIASKKNTTAPQLLPKVLKVGTIYECRLKVGVKICLNYMTVMSLKVNGV